MGTPALLLAQPLLMAINAIPQIAAEIVLWFCELGMGVLP